MQKELIVTRSVIIHTNSSKVWDVLTKPELIKEYLFGTNTITDWKAGSEIAFGGEYKGQKYRDHGKILENMPQQKLSYTYWSGFSGLPDRPENYAVITYILKKLGEAETEFTWTQAGFAGEENRKHSENGMDQLLQTIRSISER